MKALRSFFPVLLVVVLARALMAAATPEAAALAVLASSADQHEKARACQELGVYGGPAAVPALAALLKDERLSDYARSGLEGIKDPAAAKALRNALSQLEGRRLAGVVNSLGVRRDSACVPDLRELALQPSRGVSPEALASLGLIGTGEAAKALQDVLIKGPADLRLPAGHAALVAAAQLEKDNNPSAARSLLESIVRVKPSAHLATVAQIQVTALRTRR